MELLSREQQDTIDLLVGEGKEDKGNMTAMLMRNLHNKTIIIEGSFQYTLSFSAIVKDIWKALRSAETLRLFAQSQSATFLMQH